MHWFFAEGEGRDQRVGEDVGGRNVKGGEEKESGEEKGESS
jgi:hypothetical protein